VVLRLPQLFDHESVITLAAPIDTDAVAELTAAERALVERAIEKRKREFATGRKLARAALAELDHRGVEILNGPDRAPIWPRGIAGSISHCDRVAVVAMTRAEHGTLGVDVEHREELKRDLWKTVFLPREIEALDAAFDPPMRGRMALVLFSAKEALYKAQYPRTTTFMGFHELHVAITPDPHEPTRGTLRCTFQKDVGALDRDGFARASVAHGRFQLDAMPGADVLTSVLIPSMARR
jgi:4'-phosphopantetheinyl transferase EntD